MSINVITYKLADGTPQLAVSFVPDNVCYHCRYSLRTYELRWANGAWRSFHPECVFG